MKRMIMLAIALLAISIFVLPVTLSLFSGQHCWYNLTAGGNQVPCEKCHADVAEEMNALAGPHTNETGYGEFKCEYCHRTFDLNDYGQWHSQNINQSIFSNYYFTYASGDDMDAQPGVEAHAASTVPCMYCHSGEDVGNPHPSTFTAKSCSCHGSADGGDPYYYHGDRFYTGSGENPGECVKCHKTGPVTYVPPAGGFSLTTNATDTGSRAAHKTFVMNAISNPDMEDANEACIGCHTKIRVESNFNVTSSLMISVNDSYNLSASYWNVVNISPDGYITYKEVKEG